MAHPQDREQRFAEVASGVGVGVRRYLVRRLDHDQVDDVLAEVFLVLWRRLDDVPADAPLPWAYGVARRCVANDRRSARRRRDLVEKVTRLDPPPAYAEDAAGAGEEHAEVYAALGTLGELDREIVMLWAWEQLPPREIAALLDLTPNAVSVRLTRAKDRLRGRLGKDPGGPGQRRDEGSPP